MKCLNFVKCIETRIKSILKKKGIVACVYEQFRMYGSRVRPVNPQISLLAMALRPLKVKAT